MKAGGVLLRVHLPSQTTPSIILLVRMSGIRHADADTRRRRFVELDLFTFFATSDVVRVILEQAPALVLRQEPHAVGQALEGSSRAVVEELHVVLVVSGLAQAVE